MLLPLPRRISDAHLAGHYRTLYEALQRWVRDPFPFTRAHCSNVEIPD
ncbi:hypothetical protein [Pseudactinotalea suaedae]|nr:hypothetical protein [Pseudactinotalea suaedae]